MKWQVRSKAFRWRKTPAVSVIEADHVQPLADGSVAFTDLNGKIVALVQRDSWCDIIPVP